MGIQDGAVSMPIYIKMTAETDETPTDPSTHL